MKHTNFINIAIRILSSYQKGLLRHETTSHTSRLKEYEYTWIIYGSGYLYANLLNMIKACKARMYTTKRNTVFGISNAIKTFGRHSVMALVNSAYDPIAPGASYTETHDLDDLSFTREALNDFCEKICKEVWCISFCNINPYEPVFEFDQADFETRWQSWEYWGKYATICFYK